MFRKNVIRIPKHIWKSLQKSALKFIIRDKPLVFALYSKRRTHWDIIRGKEIPTVKSYGKSEEGFFIYTYPGEGK
jgi:hypothetical protein